MREECRWGSYIELFFMILQFYSYIKVPGSHQQTNSSKQILAEFTLAPGTLLYFVLLGTHKWMWYLAARHYTFLWKNGHKAASSKRDSRRWSIGCKSHLWASRDNLTDILFFGHLGLSPGLLTVLENMTNSREEGINCCCRVVLWCWLTSGQPHDNKATQSGSTEEKPDGSHEKLGFPLLTSRGYSQCEGSEASGERHSGKLMRDVWARAFWNQFLSRGWPRLFQLTLVPLKCVTWMRS